ncbi:MAG: VWA domain-containing protein [Proteobacteria bacterium]|nr:VWA domain-containing protein [Pseudomonadota bacterium]
MTITAIESKLSEYDFIVVIDTSGSMGEPLKAGSSRSRWEAMQESVGVFVRDIEKLDSDGIDVVQLGGSVNSWHGVTSAKVSELFASLSPRGSTPLAEALTTAFAAAGKSDKKDFIIVFTDGVPDDQGAAKQVILNQANKQTNDDDCTVLFVQVGDDARATAYLRGLDDDLRGAKFDIVDAKTMIEAEAFATTSELVLAAIND